MADTVKTGAQPGARPAVLAGFLGWTLDAFDFFVVVFLIDTLAQHFHVPKKDIVLTMTATLAMRPVGAVIFGLLSDRYGRRVPLMCNVIYFSVIELLCGFSPNYTFFFVMRALFGIGMGGEWGVGASLAMEKAPAHRRGVLSGILQEGYACGNLLAALCFLFVFPRWGWRPMFFIGGIPALLALYVRSFVKESEVWERTRHRDWGAYGRGLVSHMPLFFYLFVLMILMVFISHGTQDMYPTFLKRDWNLTPQRIAVITALANVGAITGGVIFGYYSDRVGRRRAIVAALVLALAVIPLWAFSRTVPLLVIGGFMMQFMVQGAWGVIPAHINELAPDTVRGFLPGFAYQCGAAVGGTIAYIEAVFADHMTYATAMASTAATVFILGAIAAWAGKEKRGIAFGEVAPVVLE